MSLFRSSPPVSGGHSTLSNWLLVVWNDGGDRAAEPSSRILNSGTPNSTSAVIESGFPTWSRWRRALEMMIKAGNQTCR